MMTSYANVILRIPLMLFCLVSCTIILCQAFQGRSLAARGSTWRSARRIQSRRPFLVQMSSSMSSSSTDAPNKEYAPSQYSIDETTGEKWRLCVGAAVLNSHNQLLVGERLGIPNAWQCPQGGVDDAWKGRPKETIFEASSRELFEEMGLEVGTHVLHVVDPSYQHPVEPPVRYRTNGTSTSNWLTKAGFAGQEIHWTVFRCVDARGDQDPAAMCDLSGTGGEHAEFSKVQWQDLDEVVATIWETKREPYLALQRMLMLQNETKAAQDDDWQNQMKSLDFGGKWTRESSSSIGLVEALVGRGLTQDEAEDEAKKPYIQSWRRSDETNCTWVVTTYQVDGVTPRRELEYCIGEWEEHYQGQAVLFGTSETGTTILKRRTAFVAEPDADPVPMAHVTVTDGPKGVEESRRYLKKDGKFVLRRTLWPKDTPETPIISTEVFVVYS